MAAQTEMSCSDPAAVLAPPRPPVLQCAHGRQDERCVLSTSPFSQGTRKDDSVYREEQKASVSRAGSERYPHTGPQAAVRSVADTTANSGSRTPSWPRRYNWPLLSSQEDGDSIFGDVPRSLTREHSRKPTPPERLFADWAATAAVFLTFLCLLSPSLTKIKVPHRHPFAL